jgi:hypothetical protein
MLTTKTIHVDDVSKLVPNEIILAKIKSYNKEYYKTLKLKIDPFRHSAWFEVTGFKREVGYISFKTVNLSMAVEEYNLS